MGRKFLDEEDNTEYEKLLQPPPRPVTDQEQAPQPAALAQPEYVPTREMAPIAGSKLPQPELEQPPEDAMAAYQRLSKQAEEATPSEEDVLAANMRRTGAQLRAEAPAYLEKAAETLFYKPDYSQITRVAEGEAKQPDMILSAKEQAQRRLEALAEGARKRALLPAQQAEMQAKTAELMAKSQEAQSKLEDLKPATDQERATAEQELGIKFGPGTKKGDISKARAEATQTTIKGRGVPLDDKRRQTYEKMINLQIRSNKLGEPITLPENVTEEDAKNLANIAAKGNTSEWRQVSFDLRQQQLDFNKQKFGFKQEEEERSRTVPGYGKATTPKNAEKFLNQVVGTQQANATIDNLKDSYKQYENTPWTDISKNSKLLNDISLDTATLLINLKEKFNLGALQEHEMKFMQNITGPSDGVSIVKDQLLKKMTGNTIGQKLDSMKKMINRDLKTSKDFYIIEPEESKKQQPPAAAPTTPTSAELTTKPITALKNNVEHTKMLKPDGSAVYVPSTQVQDFIDKRQYKFSPK